jgi:KaiC/GvpD/RAD55 family RecA-like ATPase
MKIVKLRETKHEEDFIPFEIGKRGIEIREMEKFKV